MLALKYKEALPLLPSAKYQPCISVIMPFEPKMNSKVIIMQSLKTACNKIERELYNNYEKNMAYEALNKLKNTIESLDYSTHKKSIALYISSAIQKVYYLDIAVNEKIIVTNSFEIRDTILNKKIEQKFLLLTISEKSYRIFAGNGRKLQLIASNNGALIQSEQPEPVTNFTDAEATEEKLKRFLDYIDKRLAQILKVYHLPLFVMSAQKTMGYFESITRHQQAITGFLHGNFDDATEKGLLKPIEPYFKNWQAVKEKDIVNRLEIAQNDGNLATGIHDVWIRANHPHKQLLVVEKDFYCPAFVTEKGETIFTNRNGINTIIANDAIDDIIEKVLQNGGDVEFVDELRNYNRIALIKQIND